MVNMRKASDFLRFYRDQSVRVHKAKEMSDEELEGKIVIGKLVERERTEFGASLRRINEKFREGRA
jgi:2-oxoglutarate ferredoxin oxidoreductase subunit beta